MKPSDYTAPKLTTEVIRDILEDMDGNNYDAVIEFELQDDEIIGFTVIEGAGKLEFDDVFYMAASLKASMSCDVNKILSKSF